MIPLFMPVYFNPSTLSMVQTGFSVNNSISSENIIDKPIDHLLREITRLEKLRFKRVD